MERNLANQILKSKMENKSTENSKSWLQRLKDESWEAEVLISTVAIIGTIQLFKVIDWLAELFIDMLSPAQYLVGYGITFGGLLALSILATMFVIHFILRAYWVGLVGLNSVFPDYGLEDSAYSEIFTKKFRGLLPKLKNTIQEVDELCSVIFSAAFFMLFLYIYYSLIGSIYLLIYNFLSPYVPSFVLLIPIFAFAAMYTIAMLFNIVANLKMFKNNASVQSRYFQVTKWSSLLSLGPLYKYLLQISMTFATNYKKKKSITALIITFLAIGFFITFLTFKNSKIPYLVNQEFYYDSTKVYHDFYKSENNSHNFLIAPQIDADIYEKKIMQLFIPVYKHEFNQLKEPCGKFQENEQLSEKEQKLAEKKWYLNCFNIYHEVFLNEKAVAAEFLKYTMPNTEQFGVITYINLKEAKTGQNVLKVTKNLNGNLREWVIPFQYISQD